MESFNLLSNKMKNKIWDMGWEVFTEIQDKAIPVIVNTNKDVIISSSTASGKTEAAFLPILSLIEEDLKTSLKVLYISPLKALINNQFDRIENLISSLNINVYRWHGDISHSKKIKFLKEGNGILQITPESLESLFINRTNYLGHLFKDLDFIVIDEIHAFLNNERGVQLRSLIDRIENYTYKAPRIVGLSATISNYDYVKRWIRERNINNIELVEETSSTKVLNYSLMHFNETKDYKIPMELFKDIREITREGKNIIFCNNRALVEEMTVLLNRLAKKEKVDSMYYPHHSSIDKSIREFVEKIMTKSNEAATIIATSSLELGIDIGDLQIVIQVNSTNTVSSLKQRLGRSGRKKDEEQYLQLYTTNNESLLKSIAVMELQLEKWIEPAEGYKLPYDVLFQQIISICCEFNGLKKKSLIEKINLSNLFSKLDSNLIIKLVDYMTENGYLECLNGKDELIVGLTGEKILRSKEFYSVFLTQQEYDVLYISKKIGKVERNVFLNPGNNIILAGKLWTIENINDKKEKIYVVPANNAKPPQYSGSFINFDKKIGYKMMEILCNKKDFEYINENAKIALEDMRLRYRSLKVDINNRVIWSEGENMIISTFTGTKIYITLAWMLKLVGVNVIDIDDIGSIKIQSTNIIEKIEEMKVKKWDLNEILKITQKKELFKSKYSKYLPDELQLIMHVEQKVDLDGAIDYLKKFNFIVF
ncbi:TPA: DEAD/DEAH box helicase [Clostridium perfringens]